MKPLIRIIFVVCIVNILVSSVLLLNITATNPTHRRYSTDIPLTTGQGAPGDLGDSGERVLSKDLGQPRNDLPDQRQCLCNGPSYKIPSTADCRTCVNYYQSLTASFRRPDFINEAYIAESKNTLDLRYRNTDILNQIGDYALAARTLNRPLWVYTRVDTNIDPEYTDIVARTGGAVIPYFVTPGYVDPVDTAARSVLIGSALLAILFAFILRVSPMVIYHQPRTTTTYVTSQRSDPTPDPVGDAHDALDKADEFNKINRRKLDL